MPWTSTTTRSSGFLVTAAVWNNELVNNMQFIEEVAYTEFTSNVSITATTDATANQIVSAGAITYENVPHLIMFQAFAVPDNGAIGRSLVFNLYDGSTDIGRLGTLTTPAAQTMRTIVHLERRVTPTAASHTYSIRAWTSPSGTAAVNAGAGGAATDPPGFIRIVRIPT